MSPRLHWRGKLSESHNLPEPSKVPLVATRVLVITAHAERRKRDRIDRLVLT